MITERIRFKKFFDVDDKFRDDMITTMTKRYSIDIIKFDDWLHKEHGYDEEIHGSMNDFIILRFGEKACSFIESLL
uniref:Uncharacterized protein n=1 Tax=viral metagenome TaxID=1070528 RepID=A0A6M3K357_9ZZZZ